MAPRLRRLIAREFLIFIVPIIVLFLCALAFGFYTKLQIESVKEQIAYQETVFFEADERHADSVRTADSIAIFRMVDRMKKVKKSKMEILDVVFKFDQKSYDPKELKVNIFGREIVPPTALIDQVYKLQGLEDREEELYARRDAAFGDEGYNGFFGVVYLILLILLYPMRLLVLAILWSFKNLKAS